SRVEIELGLPEGMNLSIGAGAQNLLCVKMPFLDGLGLIVQYQVFKKVGLFPVELEGLAKLLNAFDGEIAFAVHHEFQKTVRNKPGLLGEEAVRKLLVLNLRPLDQVANQFAVVGIFINGFLSLSHLNQGPSTPPLTS